MEYERKTILIAGPGRNIGKTIAMIFALALTAGSVSGQTYPNKPIRVITTEPGSGPDFVARVVAPEIAATLGQPVVVDSRPSAVTGAIVASAPPDGYTLYLAGSSFWVGSLVRKVSYDVVKDFSPIALVSNSPFVLVVHPSLPVRNVKDLIALAKSKPGALNYAASGAGGGTQLAAELFKAQSGTNIVWVPYKATGQAVIDLIAGHVELMFASAPASTPHIKGGRLKALAVTSPQPSAIFPDLPTIAASGLPGYEAGNMNGFFAPAKTPTAIISRLNEDIGRVLHKPETKDKFLVGGVETAEGSPAQFAAKVRSEMATSGKLIKELGITGE